MEIDFLQPQPTQPHEPPAWWVITADLCLETFTITRKRCRGADEEDMRLLLPLQETIDDMAQSNRKGANAEREIKAKLEVAVREVYDWYNSQAELNGYPPATIPDLRTKDLNSAHGSHDISGIDWLAVEVKHHKTLKRWEWWEQTARQAAATGAEPVLFYKVTKVTGLTETGKWHVMMNMMKSPGRGMPMLKAPVVIRLEDWLPYFKNKLLWKLQNEPF